MWIYPEQLSVKLTQELKLIYILFGDNFCILKDCQYNIMQKAKKLNFNEYISIELDLYYDWNKIFNLCKIPDLLNQQKILSLKFPKNYPINFFNKNVSLLISFLCNKILFILHIYKPSYLTKNNILLQSFSKIGTLVLCVTPKDTKLIMWIMNQAKSMQLSIEMSACQLLSYYYEDNLILLQQILQVLSLIYSDGNLNYVRVKKIITDSAYFNINHWIEAVLIGDKKKANRILQHLEYTDINIAILLQKIQYEILILINVKYSLTSKTSVYTLLKEYKIYNKYHLKLLSQAVKRLNIKQLYQSITLLVQMELTYKKHHNYLFKSNFELLTMILCC